MSGVRRAADTSVARCGLVQECAWRRMARRDTCPEGTWRPLVGSMLHSYIRSRPARLGRSDAWLLSIAAHALVIAAAMHRTPTTTFSRGEVVREQPTVEHIRFVETVPPAREPEPSPPRRVARAVRPARPTVTPFRAPTIGPIALAAVPTPMPAPVEIDAGIK